MEDVKLSNLSLSVIKELNVSDEKESPPNDAMTLRDGFCVRKASRSAWTSETKSEMKIRLREVESIRKMSSNILTRMTWHFLSSTTFKQISLRVKTNWRKNKQNSIWDSFDRQEMWKVLSIENTKKVKNRYPSKVPGMFVDTKSIQRHILKYHIFFRQSDS